MLKKFATGTVTCTDDQQGDEQLTAHAAAHQGLSAQEAADLLAEGDDA